MRRAYTFGEMHRSRISTLPMYWRNLRRDYISIADKHAANEIFDDLNGLTETSQAAN